MYYFTDRVRDPQEGFASFDDPLRVKSCVVYADPPSECTPLDSLGIDREVALIAFLSWWLSYFVVPSAPIGFIRPSTFVMLIS